MLEHEALVHGNRAVLEDHYKFVKKERAGAIMRANDAVMNPSQAMSMAIDGTSQLPKGFPLSIHGEEKSLNRLHHHFALAVVHGVGTKCYVTRDNVASDPNLTVEVLQRTLQYAEEARGGKLPPKLYLQLDNCWRENKNCLVMNWIASLTERGLFPDGIYVSFLPVGHTHNEVDQVASRISIAVRNRAIHTPEELLACLSEAFDDMTVEIVQHVADTKGFLNPNGQVSWTKSRFKRLQNVSAYRYFRFHVNEVQEVECQTRNSQSGLWSQPFFPIKGQGTESRATTKVNKPRVRQSEGYGLSAVKAHDAVYLEEVMLSLDAVRTRLAIPVWDRLISLYDEIFKSEPVPFHWRNGGVFTTETHLQRVAAGDSDEDATDDEDELEVRPARGIFQHWDQVTRHRENPEPSSIKLGSMVAVKEGAKNLLPLTLRTTARTTNIGFRLAQVLRVHKHNSTVDIQYFNTSAKMLSVQTTFRPQVLVDGVGGEGVAHSRVRGQDCFLTFHNLTSMGRIRSSHVRCILYVLKCHAVREDVDQSNDVLQPEKFRVRSIDEYMADTDARPVNRLGGSKKQRKRTNKRTKAVVEEDKIGTDSDTDGESSQEDAENNDTSPDDSGDGEGAWACSESDEDDKHLTKQYFLSACKGQTNCACTFEMMLEPGMNHGAVLGVFNHNVRRARMTEGKHWTAVKRGTEWDRLMALTVDTKRKRTRRDQYS